jgi:hypothetical protein
MSNTLKNTWLALKYKLFKSNQKKFDFGVPTAVLDFNNPDYLVSDLNPYQSTMICLKENVEVKNGKLFLHTRYENRIFSNWWGSENKIWSIGHIDFKNNAYPFGIWSVKCRLPNDKDDWPAIWLLRKRHAEHETKIDLGNALKADETSLFLPAWKDQRVELNWFVWCGNTILGFVSAKDKVSQKITVDQPIEDLTGKQIFVSPDHITPEVDIMEIIHGKIQHTIHYGYSNQEYRKTEWNVKRGKPHLNKEYEFSVELSRSGYRFFIDRVLVGVLKDQKAISDSPAYLIINSAKQNGITTGENSVFEISEVRFYDQSKG